MQRFLNFLARKGRRRGIVIFFTEKTRFNLFFNQPSRLVSDIGYDDFRFVSPMKLFWVQPKYTMHYVVKGKGRLQVEGKTYSLSASEGFVLPPSVPFCYYPDEKEPWSYFWFGLNESAAALLDSLSFDAKNPTYCVSATEEIEKTLSEALTLCTADTPADSFLADAAFLKALSLLARERRGLPSPLAQEKREGNGEALTKKLDSLIRANFENPDMTVALLCQMAHVSHSYACKIYKAQRGMRMQDFLTACRMEKAEALLLGGASAKETAFAVGYRDAIHFSKEFRRFYGNSPIAHARLRGRE